MARPRRREGQFPHVAIRPFSVSGNSSYRRPHRIEKGPQRPAIPTHTGPCPHIFCSFSSTRPASSSACIASQPHHPFHSPPAGMSSALPLPAVQDHSPSLPSAVLLLVCCFPSSPSVHTDSSQAPSYLASSCLPSLPSALCCLPALSLLVLRYVRPTVSALCISQAFCSSSSCVLLPLHFPLAFRAGGRYDRR